MIAIPNMGMPDTCDMCPIEGCEYINGKFTCPLIDIVTCGECKYGKYKIEDAEYVKCKITQLFVNKSDFCSYGERRNDGHI